MDTSSGKINYWPGFVDAFSNLVLALVFVIVILAMSLGMFSGLMAKMAIQRALVDQQLKESRAAQGGSGAPPAEPVEKDAEPAESAAPAPAATADTESPETPAREPAQTPAREPAETAAAETPDPAALRQENDALRQEIAALRKQNATLAQSAAAPAAKPTPSSGQKPEDRFGPTMPEGDRQFNQHIEDDLQRALKEFEARRDEHVNINVAIYMPNYALTENKRTALFYLISIKDYLMKRKVPSERIHMHMTPAQAGQKDMTVTISVEP